jgi:hypothetical protein
MKKILLLLTFLSLVIFSYSQTFNTKRTYDKSYNIKIREIFKFEIKIEQENVFIYKSSNLLEQYVIDTTSKKYICQSNSYMYDGINLDNKKKVKFHKYIKDNEIWKIIINDLTGKKEINVFLNE